MFNLKSISKSTLAVSTILLSSFSIFAIPNSPKVQAGAGNVLNLITNSKTSTDGTNWTNQQVSNGGNYNFWNCGSQTLVGQEGKMPQTKGISDLEDGISKMSEPKIKELDERQTDCGKIKIQANGQPVFAYQYSFEYKFAADKKPSESARYRVHTSQDGNYDGVLYTFTYYNYWNPQKNTRNGWENPNGSNELGGFLAYAINPQMGVPNVASLPKIGEISSQNSSASLSNSQNISKKYTGNIKTINNLRLSLTNDGLGGFYGLSTIGNCPGQQCEVYYAFKPVSDKIAKLNVKMNFEKTDSGVFYEEKQDKIKISGKAREFIDGTNSKIWEITEISNAEVATTEIKNSQSNSTNSNQETKTLIFQKQSTSGELRFVDENGVNYVIVNIDQTAPVKPPVGGWLDATKTQVKYSVTGKFIKAPELPNDYSIEATKVELTTGQDNKNTQSESTSIQLFTTTNNPNQCNEVKMKTVTIPKTQAVATETVKKLFTDKDSFFNGFDKYFKKVERNADIIYIDLDKSVLNDPKWGTLGTSCGFGYHQEITKTMTQWGNNVAFLRIDGKVQTFQIGDMQNSVFWTGRG